MPRTWSNAKVTDTRSVAERLKTRPASPTTFLVLLGIAILFFTVLMAYTTIHTLRHPSPERYLPQAQPPKED